MQKLDGAGHTEEFQAKLDRHREERFQAEVEKLKNDTLAKAGELIAQRRSELDRQFQERLLQARDQREKRKTALLQLQLESIEQLSECRSQRIEARRRIEEERQRIEAEARRKAEEERKRAEEERQRAEARRQAEEARRRAEEERQRAEAEARRKAEEERIKAEEERRRQEEERRKQEERARLAAEEAAERNRREEEIRKADEERLRAEIDARKRLEEELRRKMEEGLRRKEEAAASSSVTNGFPAEAPIVESEEEQKQLERQKRIESLLASARLRFSENNLDLAALEVAKALVNDPAHAEALELESMIRRAQGKDTPPVEEIEIVPIETPRVSLPPQPVKKPMSRLMVSGIAGALILLAGIAIYQLKKSVFPKTATFAVMPWSSPDGIVEEAVLGTAISEEVAKAFEPYRTLIPMGFSSSYSLSLYRPNDNKAAFQLGYPYALLGTIGKIGNGYIIRLKLIDSLGNVSWSHDYDRSPSQLADLPASIVSDMHTALDFPREKLVLPLRTVTHPDAYLFYLRGVEMLHRNTPESYANAYQLFRQAIELDDRFAEALIMASMVLTTQRKEGYVLDNSVLAEAKQLAEDALSIAPSSGKAHLALATVAILRQEYSVAGELLDRAENLEPNNSYISIGRADMFTRTGEYVDALQALDVAFSLSPRDEAILRAYTWNHQFMNASSKAMWYHETLLYFVPDSTEYLTGPFADVILADPALTIAYYDRVAAACNRKLSSNPADYYSMYRLARLQQVMGKAIEANALLRRTEKLLRGELQLHKDNSHGMMILALTLTRLGRYPEALSLARKATVSAPSNVELQYNLAQVLSMQMYSQASKAVDEKIKAECIATLRSALAICFRPDYLTNADFYNMIERGEFLDIIKLSAAQ